MCAEEDELISRGNGGMAYCMHLLSLARSSWSRTRDDEETKKITDVKEISVLRDTDGGGTSVSTCIVILLVASRALTLKLIWRDGTRNYTEPPLTFFIFTGSHL
jgi:hypothetical protein